MEEKTISSFFLKQFFNENLQKDVNPTKSSKLSGNPEKNIDHHSLCNITSQSIMSRKKLEVSYIAVSKPNLNEQKDFEGLALFRKMGKLGVIKNSGNSNY